MGGMISSAVEVSISVVLSRYENWGIVDKCTEVRVGEVTKPLFNHFYMNVPKISSFVSFAPS